MELNIERIEQGVIEAAVEQLMESGIYRRATDAAEAKVKERMDAIFTEQVQARIEEAVNQAITDGFNRTYVKVTGFGQPSGQPTTIAKELEALTSNYWEAKVDSQGRPAEGYSAKMTRAEYVMGKILVADFSDQIKQLVVNSAGQFKDALRVSLHGTVNEVLSSILRVNSLGDQQPQTPRTGSACIDPKQQPMPPTK